MGSRRYSSHLRSLYNLFDSWKNGNSLQFFFFHLLLNRKDKKEKEKKKVIAVAMIHGWSVIDKRGTRTTWPADGQEIPIGD